jgi:tricorn protease-like protein
MANNELERLEVGLNMIDTSISISEMIDYLQDIKDNVGDLNIVINTGDAFIYPIDAIFAISFDEAPDKKFVVITSDSEFNENLCDHDHLDIDDDDEIEDCGHHHHECDHDIFSNIDRSQLN